MNKQLLISLLAIASTGLTLVPCVHAAETTPIAPFRLTTVKTNTPPTIDGDMNQTDWIGPEWGAAAAFTGFTDAGNRKYATRQSRGYFTYDADKLYFAFSSDIEAGTKPAATITQRDGALWGDDSFEFLISPPGEDTKEKPVFYQFIGNSAGVFYDAKGSDKSWDGKWQYAAKTYGTKWIAEGSIRWADLGMAAPKDGETLRLNFCRDWQNPLASTSWGPSNNFSDVSQFAYVTFREKGTVARVENLGKFTSGNVKFAVELSNLNGAAAEDVVGILGLGTALTTVNATVAPNSKSKLEFATTIPDKTTDSLSLRVDSKTTGQTLWQSSVVFDKTDPVVVELQAMPSKSIVEVKVDVSGVPGRPAGATAKVAFMGDNASKKVAEVTCTPFDEQGRSFTELPLAKLPVGNYVVITTLYDGQTRLNESRSHFNRIDESWMGNKIGITDKILPGWTPISVSSKTMRMWGRDVSFNNSLFPSQILSRGASLLDSPIRLEGMIDGKPIVWDKVTFKVTKKTAARVDFITTASSGALSVENEAYLEYDGMFFFKMHLKPTAKKIKIDSLKLVVPFAAGRAIFMNKSPGDFSEDYGGRRLPEGEGSIWKRPFANYMWVGDYDRGLQWFAEDDTQWSIPENKKTLELTRKNKVVEWGITFADAAMELSDTRTIAFGLHPTPVKPLPKASRMLSMASHQGQSPGIIWTDPTNTKYFGYPEASDVPYVRSRTDNFHEHGVRVLPYMCPVRIGEESPEWKFFGRDWAMPGVLNNYDVDVLEFSGGQMGACPSIPAFRDWMTWKNKEFLGQTGFDGLYYDFAWPYPCFHAGHGHAVGALPLLGFREMYRRLYTLCKERNPNDLIVAHISGGIFMPMLSWVDTTVPGEEIVGTMMKARENPATKDTTDLADVIDLDYYVAFNMGRQFGPVPTYMQPVWAEARYHNAFMLLTDSVGAWRYDPPLIQLYDDLGMGADDVRFLPYWDNGKIVQTNFTDAPEGVKGDKYPQPLASLYQRPDKFVLFAVTNLTKTDRKVSVKFDPSALKIDLRKYALTDAYSRAPLFAAKSTFEVSVPARSFRLLMLKKTGKDEKTLALGADIPHPEANIVFGTDRIRGEGTDLLYVGDATRDEKLPLPQESRVAQSFTLKKATKIERVRVEIIQRKGGRSGNFCDLRIYHADANGAPTAVLADPRAWSWHSSIPGFEDYYSFYFKNSFILPPGRYAFVLSKAPALPTERHHYKIPLWESVRLPGETASVWTSATKRWEKANGIISFGINGREQD